MATANPAMNEAVYRRAGPAEMSTQAMTIQGSVLKTAILVMILLATGAFTWAQAVGGATGVAYGLLIAGSIGGFIVALITIFNPKASPFTAPIYAALEGLVLGAISAVFETIYGHLNEEPRGMRSISMDEEGRLADYDQDDAEASGCVVANKRSQRYYLPSDGGYARASKAKLAVFLRSEEVAVAMGYRRVAH